MENKFLNRFSNLLFYFSILSFIIAFNFAHNPPNGWYQQFLPSTLPNIVDITFTDSLTGYAVTGVDGSNHSYIIKTSNGGDNWNVIFQDSGGRAFTKVKFINNTIGFACTIWNSGSAKLYKTTNGGDLWFTLNNPVSGPSYLDLSVLSEEELWCTDNIAFDGGVFRTTNGGINWQRKYYDIANGADRIYMVNSRIGFIANGFGTNNFLRKTTDYGNSWSLMTGVGGFYHMYFLDTLTGWKSTSFNLLNTTNGGLNWDTSMIANWSNPDNGMLRFAVVNRDSIWGVGDANILYPNNQFRGIILRTTNRGVNWGYQLPDTSISIPFYSFIDFIDSKNGWAYLFNGVHTVSGGDTITFTNLNSNIETVPKVFKLHQNYPNPFNPKTKIEYELQTSNFTIIKIYNMQGREINSIINKKQAAGNYQIEFDGSGLPSGVYFYSLFIDNLNVATKKMLLIK